MKKSGKACKVDKSTFCVLPFSHLFANEVGDMHFCCMAVESEQPICEESGRPYSFKQPEKIEEAWNSAFMKKARIELLTGRKPEACLRCFKTEASEAVSFRSDMNEKYKDIIEPLIEQTAADGTLEFMPYSVDIRLGNTCNLRCRMCSPQASRSMIEDWSHLFPNADPQWLSKLKKVDWFSNEAYWKVILSHLGNIRNFHFAGGEPMLIDQMYVFLQKLIATGHSRKISLSYNTNITHLPEKVYNLWPKFKTVHLALSVDGTEHMNSYIRYPSSWEKILSHLDELDKNAEKLNIGFMKINTTVQAYNIFDLPEFLRMVIPRFKRIHYPGLSLLYNPPHLSAQALPLKMRQKAKRKLLKFQRDFAHVIPWCAKYPNEAIRLNQEIRGVIDYLEREDHSSEFAEFQRTTLALDQRRQQSLVEVAPEFAPYFPAKELPLATT